MSDIDWLAPEVWLPSPRRPDIEPSPRRPRRRYLIPHVPIEKPVANQEVPAHAETLLPDSILYPRVPVPARRRPSELDTRLHPRVGQRRGGVATGTSLKPLVITPATIDGKRTQTVRRRQSTLDPVKWTKLPDVVGLTSRLEAAKAPWPAQLPPRGRYAETFFSVDPAAM